MIQIDRITSFDRDEIERLRGSKWKITSQDESQSTLAEIDLGSLPIESMPQDSFNGITEINLPYDARTFRAIWESRDRIPKSWNGKIFLFYGTKFGGIPHHREHVLALVGANGPWRQELHALGDCI